MSAVILASGKASRLGPIAAETPKPMLEFEGKPYLEYLIDWLLSYGIDDVVVTTCTHAEKIEGFVNARYDSRIVRTVREPTLSSTMRSASYGLRAVRHETSFLLTADNIWNLDLASFARFHRNGNFLASVLLTANPAVPNAGKVKVASNRDIVLEMWPTGQPPPVDKTARLASTMGIYIVEAAALLSSIRPSDSSIEREPMDRLVPRVGAYWNEGFFFDYGTPGHLAYLQDHPEIIRTYLQS